MKRHDIIISPSIEALDWVYEQIAKGIYSSVDEFFDKAVYNERLTRAFLDEYKNPTTSKFYDR